MAVLFWLSDAQWAVMEPFMPKNQPGARRVDDRRTISGIVHVIRSGCRWQDCPRDYGPPTTVYNRFNRWAKAGVWLKVFEVLAARSPQSLHLIDSSIVRAHQHAAGRSYAVRLPARPGAPLGSELIKVAVAGYG